MTYLTTAQVTAICDNITKSLLDIETDFITDPGANSPTVATITSGQNGNSNSLLARVGAWTLPATGYTYADKAAPKLAAAVINYLNVPFAGIYAVFAPFLIALDQDAGDLAEFLANNSLQVHPEFAKAFNYVASNAMFSGLANYTPTPLMPPVIFPSAQNTFSSIAVTGASTGTITPGTALDMTKVAAQEIWLYNPSGSPSTATASVITFTYVDAGGTSHTGQTVTLSGALASHAYIDTGLVGQNATITAVATGTNGDSFALVSKLLRSVAY